MSNPTFNPGDKVRVSEAWLGEHPESPLPGRILVVCVPGRYPYPGRVAISCEGNIWYVPPEFISHVEEEAQ